MVAAGGSRSLPRPIALLAALTVAVVLRADDAVPRMPMQARWEDSAEARRLAKPVRERRTLEDWRDARRWRLRGEGSFQTVECGGGGRCAQVQVAIEHGVKSASWSGTAQVTLERALEGEDWSGFNRIYFRLRPRMTGFRTLTITVSFQSDGVEKTPDVYRREGTHYVTAVNGRWLEVAWEITPIPRDRVTQIAFRYFCPKRLPDPGDEVRFEIGAVELQRVVPDHYEGWGVAPGRIAFSHSGYLPGHRKTALTADLGAAWFELVDAGTGEPVLRKAVERVRTRLGEFERLEFTEVDRPGRYFLRAGQQRTPPFRIHPRAWRESIVKTINFFYGQRCGIEIPGVHDACHRDWQAVHGDRRIIMNGGWHDAGDLSQGLVHTGEAVYSMLALAQALEAAGWDAALIERLLEEARWGLDWVLRVRFPGGYRIGFAGMNIWTNGILGDADDRVREALNNSNVNYIAAAAAALAARLFRHRDPHLAVRALAVGEQDWEHAVTGRDIPETRHTPAYAAAEMELAGQGVLASLELYQATGKPRYAEHARRLARVILASQETGIVGSEFPLSGFFYTGPDRQEIFHQFHRAADQAPVVALARLCELFPDDPEWMNWYAAIALHAAYLMKKARITEPWHMLPAYVYRDDDWRRAPEGDRYQSSREAYRLQVLEGMPMGGGYYLKAFPVWFGRRGNYGVLLSQAKALATAARLRGDREALELALRQLEWIVGRNPFCQSTMWGEGYDFAQQYSVSSGDLVGSLPVGMMTRGNRDLPYWPPQNSYVYKEVWVHPSARWLWVLADVAAMQGVHSARACRISLSAREQGAGEVLLRLEAAGAGERTFRLRGWNLQPTEPPARKIRLNGRPQAFEWRARLQKPGQAWVALVLAEEDPALRAELVGPAGIR